MIGKGTIRLGVKGVHLDPECFKEWNGDRSCRAIAAIDGDLESVGELEALGPVGDVRLDHLGGSRLAWSLDRTSSVGDVAKSLQFIPPDRHHTAGDLQSVVLDRIVAAGDHHSTIGTQVLDRPVEQGSRNLSHLDDIESSFQQAISDSRGKGRTGIADIVADGDRAAPLGGE